MPELATTQEVDSAAESATEEAITWMTALQGASHEARLAALEGAVAEARADAKSAKEKTEEFDNHDHEEFDDYEGRLAALEAFKLELETKKNSGGGGFPRASAPAVARAPEAAPALDRVPSNSNAQEGAGNTGGLFRSVGRKR